MYPCSPRVQVEHEVGESPFQSRSQRPVHGKTSARQLGGALQVEHSQLFAQFPVRPGLEIEMRRRTPAARFDVVFGALPNRHGVMGKVWDRSQNLAQTRFLFGCLSFGTRNLLAQFFGFPNLCRGVLPALLELGNLLGSAVAARLQTFRRGDGLPALAINGAKILQNFRRIHSALPQLFFHQRQVVTNKIQIEHCALTLAENCDSVHAGGKSLEPQSSLRSQRTNGRKAQRSLRPLRLKSFLR